MQSIHVFATDRLSGKSGCYNYIIISGQSNINDFEFIWSDNGLNATNSSNLKYSDPNYLNISIPVKDFKTGNSIMYNDFLELLKAKDYPKIYIKVSYHQLEKLKTGEFYFHLEIQITIAGISKTYEIPCTVINCVDKKVIINGSKKVNLSDFNMTPPVKLQGLVKVKNEIYVDFGLMFTFENSNQNLVKR